MSDWTNATRVIAVLFVAGLVIVGLIWCAAEPCSPDFCLA